ncbi:MAG: DUF1648 domain-containing protein [Deinococcales bacterium]|nr:DUF1648 domain-containing protein [Chitinophagaceae bacterium]
MYAERPKMILTLQPLDKWLETLALSGIIWFWTFCIWAYTILPAIIPTHFNLKGVADDYGSKGALFILPAIATMVYCLITFLNQYPHIFNYMVIITTENAEKQYRLATRLLRTIKLLVIILLGIVGLIITTSTNATGISRWLGAFLPILLVLFTMPTIVYIYNTVRNNRTS